MTLCVRGGIAMATNSRRKVRVLIDVDITDGWWEDPLRVPITAIYFIKQRKTWRHV
jgi:hypothetical protein